MSPERIRLRPGHPEPRAVELVELDGREPAEAIAERVREKALAEGIVQGASMAHEGAARALSEAAARLEAHREALADELVHSAVDLAVAIARQLTHAEVGQGRHDVEAIVRETLAAAAIGRGPCVIHLHPEDLEALQDVRFRAGTSLQGDIGVSRGDVHVDTAMGQMVREIDDAIDSIAQRLREELR